MGKEKDKKCNTKGCKNLICSNLNKKGLCQKCARKKQYWDTHEEDNKISRKYYSNNSDSLKKRQLKVYYERRDYYKDLSKKNYEKNKEKIAKRNLEYANERYKLDEGFRIRKQLGSALSMVIRVYIKTGKIRNPMKKFGIDWEGIVKQLSPIPKNRSNYQIDHIIPLFKFDLTNIEQVHLAFAPENHRWLSAKENQGRDRGKSKSPLSL